MYENARYAFTETCLALTIFRGDLTAKTIALFTQLLLVKAFHWLSRVCTRGMPARYGRWSRSGELFPAP